MSVTYDKLVYEMVISLKEDEGKNEYKSYGIKITGIVENSKDEICVIHDISLNSQFVENMLHLFNDYQLSKEHFYDCVYDFVADKYTI